MRKLAMHACDLLMGIGLILTLPGALLIGLSQLLLSRLGYQDMF